MLVASDDSIRLHMPPNLTSVHRSELTILPQYDNELEASLYSFTRIWAATED